VLTFRKAQIDATIHPLFINLYGTDEGGEILIKQAESRLLELLHCSLLIDSKDSEDQNAKHAFGRGPLVSCSENSSVLFPKWLDSLKHYTGENTNTLLPFTREASSVLAANCAKSSQAIIDQIKNISSDRTLTLSHISELANFIAQGSIVEDTLGPETYQHEAEIELNEVNEKKAPGLDLVIYHLFLQQLPHSQQVV